MNEHEILLVRPYGGCAILWDCNVNYDIVKLNFKSKSLCGIKVCISDNVTMIVVNVYMPCDLRVVGCNSMLYTELLNEISSFLHQHDPMYYVIGGDFNTDFSTESMLQFMLSENLFCGVIDDNCSITHTFSSVDGRSCS